jgi:predicted transcriptional regulator
MKTLSLKLPDDLDARLAALATRQGASKSEVVRSALNAYLARGDDGTPGSALELAGELVGAFEGPDDLSHADRHMDGYGA